MKSKVRVTLLLIVLFVIAMTTAFAQTRAFDDSHIAVTIENAGPGGIVVIGSTVKVTLTDPEYTPGSDPPNEIQSASVNFSQFGGGTTVAMTWDAVLTKWKADYTVIPGAVNTTTAKVIVTGNFFSGGSSIIPDDQLFTVNNIAGTLGPLDIVTTVTNPGTNGTAIVGSTISVTFTSAVVTSASVNFASFGGGVVPMVKSGNTFLATYDVVPGTNDGSYKVQIIAYEGANPNPGTALDNDNTSINNVLPSASDFLTDYLAVNDIATATLMKKGDTLYLRGTLKTAGNTIVDTLWINWRFAFPGDTNAPLAQRVAVVNGAFVASFQPAENSLSYNSDIGVKIVKMKTRVGNVTTAGWEYIVTRNNATVPVPILADLFVPSITGVRDLFYDLGMPLRFSPVVAVVDSFGTTPNDFKIRLTIPSWGTAGGPHKFKLRFTNENRSEFFLTYTYGDSLNGMPIVESIGGDSLQVRWDGKNAGGTLEFPAAEITYGITLWEIADEVGNQTVFTHVSPDELINEYPGHHFVSDGAVFNRIHVVVDNVAPTYEQDLLLVEQADSQMFRMINDINANDLWDLTENDVRFTHTDGINTDGAVGMNFQVRRTFTNDTNPRRYENQFYWVVLQKQGTFDRWAYTNSGWMLYDAFITDIANKRKPISYSSDTAPVSNMESVIWNLENRAYPAGSYILNAYVQDNAGNIVKSSATTVTITDVFMNLPLITSINLVSQHVGTNPLGVNGHKNFYLTTGDYYVSQDTLTFEIEVNNKNFLRETDGVELNTELLGISAHVFIPRSAFGDDNKAQVSIPVASIPESAGLLTPGVLWTIGGADQPNNYIQATSWSSEEYAIYGANQYLQFSANDADYFNLIIPTQPQDLETDPVAYNMIASAWSFSPGKPNDEYDAVSNPANDNSIDTTTLSFSVPTHDTNIDWTIELVDGADVKRSWNGTMLQTAVNRIVSREFNGLDNNGAIIAGTLETKPLTWRVIAQAHPYNDPGYTNPSAVTSDTLIVIDNTNPALSNGAGTYISATEYHRLYLDSNLVPVVTQRAVDNYFEFSVTSNELLPMNGWSVEVRKNDGTPLVNNGTTVTANIDVTSNDPVDTLFNIKATINGLSGEFTNENTVLVLRLPNDLAGNPDRYNDPVYPPYGNMNLADLRYLDSAEYYFYFNILDAKSQVTEITFTNPYDLPIPNGTAGFDLNGDWNKAVSQAWLTKDMADTLDVNFKLTAKVEGGVYYNHPHYPETTWTADLSALLGTAYTTVAPTSIVNTTRANEDSIWVLTWDSMIDPNIGPITTMNAWVEGSTLEIPVKIVTNNGTADVHTEEKAIALKVDYRPLIDNVTFKYNGTEISTLLPTMNGVQVQATVTTTNELNNSNKIISFTMSNPDSTWVFDFAPGVANEVVTQDTLGVYTYVYTWDNVSFTERPDIIDDFWIANFVFTCNTIYGSIDTYEHDMIVFENPSVVIQGIVENRNLYNNIDPDGWFAPEHTLRSLYTFVSEVNATVPPIEADFDLIKDTINNEDWQYPDAVNSGSTMTTHSETLTRGSSSIVYPFYSYVARWMVNPDVQSVWNAYEDGEFIPILFKHNQVTGQLIDNQGIKVDKMVPRYDDMLEYARSDSLPAANAYRLLSSGFPHTPQESYNINIALNVDTEHPWTAGEKIYLKYRASDYTGSGMLDIQTITPQTGWVITDESTTSVVEVDGNTYWEKVVSLVPDNPVAGNSQIFKFGRVEDAVGHVNHDLPINSTDPNYIQTSPQLTFTFSSEYITAHESIKAFQIFNGNVTDDHSSPYVKAGQPLGVKIKLLADNPQPTREEGVESFEVSSVKLNPRFITGGADTLYVDLVQNPADPLEWYLPAATTKVDSTFTTGTSLQFQYMIEYTLHYYNTIITSTREYLSDIYPSTDSPAIIALVDNVPPALTSVKIWSETLSTDGSGNLLYNPDGTIRMEGYVVLGDEEGVLEIKFQDVKPADGSHPTITVGDLERFVATPIPAPSFSWDNGVWTATYDSLHIIAPNPATNSVTITYSITDVVGNGPTTGNRMVEVVGQGPIVPLITGARYITKLDLDTNPEIWEERIIPSVATSKIEVDIFTQYSAFIEDVEIVSPQAVSVNPAYTITGTSPHFVATFQMNSVNLGAYSNGDTLSFVAKTIRHPYGQAVYNQSYPFEVTVDGKLFTDSLLVVQGEDIDNLCIDGIVSPDRNLKVTAVFKNLGEEIRSGMDPIPNDWFKLTAADLLGYDHLYEPNASTVTVDADTITVVWNIPADSLYLFNPALESSSLTVTYQNIYGLTDAVNLGFNIDTQTPAIISYQLFNANGVEFPDFNGANDPLVWTNDWYKLRVNFVDMPPVHVGIHSLNAEFKAYPETYQYASSEVRNALNSIQAFPHINDDGSGYVDLQFSGGYSGRDLAAGEYGRYYVFIDSLWVMDRFANTNHEQIVKDFWFDYNPSEMTLNINGNTENLTAQVSAQPVNIIAYTSNSISGIEGVEFRLFYDRNGNGVFDPGMDDNVSEHLSGINDTPFYDTTFPYGAQWTMTDSLYAYIPNEFYLAPNNNLRNFFLRASVITQNRNLYDVIQKVIVYDDAAPVPVPDLSPINPTIVYGSPLSNTLDILVDFHVRDAMQVIVNIYTENDNGSLTLVDTVVDTVSTPLGSNQITWNFDGKLPGTYQTFVIGKDFLGNTSDPQRGPDITLDIAGMNAVATTNIYRYERNTQTEEQIVNGRRFGANDPIGIYPAPSDSMYIILEAKIDNGTNDPLNGIESVNFMGSFIDKSINFTLPLFVVPNDSLAQGELGQDGTMYPNNFTVIGNIATARLAVPNSVFADYIGEGKDYTFSFKLSLNLIDDQFPGFEPQEQQFTSFRVDQRAPKFNLSLVLPPDTSEPISWTPGHQGSFKIVGFTPTYTIGVWPNQVTHQYDYEEVQTTSVEWSLDDNSNIWRTLVFDNAETEGNFFKQYNNWNIKGGNLNTYLGANFTGNVMVRVTTSDISGNSETTEISVNVDNEAPVTKFTDWKYSIDNSEMQGVPTNNTVTIHTNPGGTGTSDLHLYIHTNQIESDAVMPVTMYHKTPIGWEDVEYDYTIENNRYEFVIPSALLTPGTHKFAAIMEDSRGNLEGDYATDHSNISYNGALSPTEMDNAVDLWVVVTEAVSLTTDISYPADLAYLSGHKALTATVQNDPNNDVEVIRFDYREGTAWTTYGYVTKAATHPVYFELQRSDIPQYDYLPPTTKVFLLNGTTQLAEMAYNEGKWSINQTLTAGTNYQFEFGIDTNNNGIWDSSDDVSFDDPREFKAFTPTQWTLSFDATAFTMDGTYQFKAVPCDADSVELTPNTSNSIWFVIDNTEPIINNLSSVGNIVRVSNGVEINLVTDVTEALVTDDDRVSVTYQYSGKVPGSPLRKWTTIDESLDASDNYQVVWESISPLADNVDNNNNGIIDEASEAVSSYYMRAVATDLAGNMDLSEELEITVDVSPAEMLLTDILTTYTKMVQDSLITIVETTNLAQTQNKYNINPEANDPATDSVTLVASNINSLILGDNGAYKADFSYRFRAEIGNNWNPDWTLLENNVMVVNNSAETVLPLNVIQEGYYQFKVTAYDRQDNSTDNIITVIFRDSTGVNIVITKVGSQDVYSEEYVFANDDASFSGNITAKVDLNDIADISTVAFAYQNPGQSIWNNIAITSVIAPNGEVTVPWLYPNLRAPLLYLKATAQDINANIMDSKIVKLYLDTTAPNVAIESLTHRMYDGKMAVDIADTVDVVLAYTELNNDGINDVESIEFHFYDSENQLILTRNWPYNDVNMAGTLFKYTPWDMRYIAEHGEDIYKLEIVVTDFAGNLRTIMPAEYSALYFDMDAPIVTPLEPNYYVAYNEPLTINVQYDDLIGLPSDALKVLFKIDGMVRDSVDTYIVIDSTHVQFTWTPSVFDQYFTEGGDALAVNAELTLTDYMGHPTTLPDFIINVTWGTPDLVRVLVVTDVVNGFRLPHFVNLDPVDPLIPQDDPLGTNHTDDQIPAPLNLYAYARLVNPDTPLPSSISMAYRVWNSNGAWLPIGNAVQSSPSDIDYEYMTYFLGEYTRQYKTPWQIENLDTGWYEIQTSSNYSTGTRTSVVRMYIYNDNIVPSVTIDGVPPNGNVERGETYTLTPTFTGETDYLSNVLYKYRYVDTNNNNAPLSSWTLFEDEHGTIPQEEYALIPAPYAFDWTVYPFYLYNNSMQIIAYAYDKWGTRTPISSIMAPGSTNYAIATIVDTQAPDATISYEWNELPMPSWVSGLVNVPDSLLTVTAHIPSAFILSDLESVELLFNGVSLQTIATIDTIVVFEGFELPDDSAVDAGIITIITHDVHGNTNETTLAIHIDNVQPTANLVVTQDAVALTNTIERDVMAVLHANPADLPSGVEFVTYSYAMAPAADADTIWVTLQTVNEAPWTYNWDTVPANLQFGSDILVKATVTDSVGLAFDHVRSFNVTDTVTPMQIISVAGHVPVNGIIPVRLHDDVHIVTAVNDVNIPRVEYLIRANATAPWTHLAYVDVVNAHADTLLSGAFTAYADGEYQLGVRAREARVTLGNVADMVTITLDHTLALTYTGTTPAVGGFFNGDSFAVNFTVTSDDEIDPASLGLEYHIIGIDGATDAWRTPVIGDKVLTRTGAYTYVATFTDVEIYHTPTTLLNGRLDFRFSVSDKAEETPNTDKSLIVTNVMYDTTDPEVIITSVTGTGVTEIAGTYMIQLASTANIAASAWDVLYGQINEVASGIQKVEFFYDNVLIGEDAEAPYSIDWNTTGLMTGPYTLNVVATDNAGNTNVVSAQVMITPPADWEPYALITAMNFDGDNANEDVIYAEVDVWNQETINAVTLEYSSDGIAWTQFSQAINMGAYWKAQFNAELMGDVTPPITMIRTVVTYNGGLISTTKPTLAVTYSTAMGGSLVLTQPSITPNVFYNNEVRITGAVNAPRLTTMFDGSYVNPQDAIMVNGNSTVFVNIPQHGEYNFWAAAINYDTWMMQLNKVTFNTHNTGTASNNGIDISLPVPPEPTTFAYFQNLPALYPLELPQGFDALSAMNPVFVVSQNPTFNFSVNLTQQPVGTGTVVGMYYDGTRWINVPATVSGTDATFTAPVSENGYIYAVAQYTGTAFNVVFDGISPQYVDMANGDLWTVEDPTSIKFFVYDGMTQGGYTSPAANAITWQMYIDDVAVPSTYNNGFISATTVNDLAAGVHTASVVVTMNDVVVTEEKAFNVETTQPVIVATGAQLTITNRTISATITDPETGISDVHIIVNPINTGGTSMNIPLQVNTTGLYSYTFTMDDLNALGYDVNYTMPMQAYWYASNPLLPEISSEPINYTVNIEGPSIAFVSPNTTGWWLNPTFNTPLTFTVTVPQGRTMPTDGVWIDLDEVTGVGENHIQYMTLAWDSWIDTNDGRVYTYSFNFGQLLTPLATAVKLSVEAMDNYNISNESQQTYGIDLAPPVVWALAPVGDPIDNDGDGLFNEDPPNGVNEDLDWVDLDQDGFWDPEEPQIVDEDPIDYANAVIPYGTNVVVALAFQDYSGYQYLLPGGTDWHYTGQSGINQTGIQVSLNGTIVNGTVTNGTFTHNAGILDPAHYTVVASVPDVVGNVGSLAFEFDVVGGAPTITFNPLTGGGWWLNSTVGNTLTFNVASQNLPASGGVVANIYSIPANVLIQGPITPTPAGTLYSITIAAGVIPADQTGIRMDVSATDVWGGTSTSSQTYGIDNYAPAITVHTPVAGTEFTIGATVNITATVSDQTPVRAALTNANKDSKDRTGSGLSVVRMTVTNPVGTPQVFNNLTGAIAETVTASMYGTYQVSIYAKDVAGNESVASTNFIVPAPAPAITFIQLEDNTWWLNTIDNNELKFSVNSAGINLANGGVIANVYTLPSNALLQGPVTPAAVEGVYSVMVLGGVIPADQTAVRLEVSATNVLGGTSISNQLYGIDNNAPVITLTSPAEGANFNQNATVNITASISDMVATRLSGMRSAFGDSPKDRPAGSGIISYTLNVINPDGSTLFTETQNIPTPQTTYVISEQVQVSQFGSYSINLMAKDFAGNQSLVTRNFMVTPNTAPTVAFTEIAWLNSVGTNNLSFTVDSVVPVTVVANVFTQPSEALLMGPLSLNSPYSVALNGSMIPLDQTGVKLQVIVSDQYGNVTEANHYYSVDRIAPEVTIISPVEGAEITLVDETTAVNILAQFTDATGSGIAGSSLVVIDPLGVQVGVATTTPADVTETSRSIADLMLGTYIARLTVTDKAGNQQLTSVNFTVIAAPLPPTPPVALEISKAFAYPNPMAADGTGKISFTLSTDAFVNVRIYDFAGREVRSMDYNGKALGKAAVELVFDGYNNQGVKLARGTYFARVIANDGKKIVEKVVKIAIK